MTPPEKYRVLGIETAVSGQLSAVREQTSRPAGIIGNTRTGPREVEMHRCSESGTAIGPFWQTAAIAVIAPWAWYLAICLPLLIAQAVAPGLLSHPPPVFDVVAGVYASLVPVLVLALAGIYGYRRRTLGRFTTAVLGAFAGAAVQLVICAALSPLAPEVWKLAACYIVGTAYSAVAVIVAAVCSAIAVRFSGLRSGTTPPADQSTNQHDSRR